MRVVPFVLFLFVLVSSASAQTSGTCDNLRNVRYGEVLVVTGGPFSFTGRVFNTLGLNNCPDAEWKKLDPAEIKKQWKARTVILNGPRHFLMDRNTLQNPGEVATFGDLKLRELAKVQISLPSVLRGRSKPYTENRVKRTSEYLFRKGRPIYELVAPNGNTYVMQSYSLKVDPTLTEEKLATLGNHLKLPKGWTYRVTIPKEDLFLRANGEAFVLQDELENSYQRR